MTAWTTRPEPLARFDLNETAPSLLFHKWHHYDEKARPNRFFSK